MKNNSKDVSNFVQPNLTGRLLGLDPGNKSVGLAISDELQLSVRPLQALKRTSWKKLLMAVKEVLDGFDVKALVIGLPLSLDGVERSSAMQVRRFAQNFALSLTIPVFLQDERLTSREAEDTLRASGRDSEDIRDLVDSEAAVIILRDFIADDRNRLEVKRKENESRSVV